MPFSTATPEARARASQMARIAATKGLGLYGRKAVAARGLIGFMRKFELLADPEGNLDPQERAQRAADLRRSYMRLLAVKSAEVRKARKANA